MDVFTMAKCTLRARPGMMAVPIPVNAWTCQQASTDAHKCEKVVFSIKYFFSHFTEFTEFFGGKLEHW